MLIREPVCLRIQCFCGARYGRPFQYIGAPWIDHRQVADLLNSLRLDGVVFDTVTFSPVKMSYHSRNPYLTGETCRGIFVNIKDRELFEPYKAGIAMVWAIHKVHGEKLEWDIPTLDRLRTGLVNMIKQGASPFDIYATWKEDLDEFKKMSYKYTIYK